MKDFFSKCDQIRSFLQIWSHLLKKSLIENFSFRVQCCYLLLKILRNTKLTHTIMNFNESSAVVNNSVLNI